MSLFKKLFSADPEALRRKADTLFEAGDFGPAKLAYEKAIDASPEHERASLRSRAAACAELTSVTPGPINLPIGSAKSG